MPNRVGPRVRILRACTEPGVVTYYVRNPNAPKVMTGSPETCTPPILVCAAVKGEGRADT